MAVTPKITIGIVTYNCLNYTKLFLKYLRLNADIPYQLIVIDNHSTDSTIDYLSKQKDLLLVANKRNYGFGYANNQAFSRSKTPLFLGVNNDTVIFPKFLSQLVAYVKKYPRYSQFGVYSNCIAALNPYTRQPIDKEIKESFKESVSPANIVKQYYGDMNQFSQKFTQSNPGIQILETPPNFTGGWCFLVRTQEVKQVGGLFDTRFKIGFWEDVDLSWRLAEIGKIVHLNNLYIHHFTHISFKNNKLKKSDHAISHANALRFAEKWSENIRSFFKSKFSQGLTLKDITKKYFIFKVYFGSGDDLSDKESKLKSDFINSKIGFKDFLANSKK